jgi:diguanylate cyclase (GGDEF)-like protein/PAS domain S-box-containing protein
VAAHVCPADADAYNEMGMQRTRRAPGREGGPPVGGARRGRRRSLTTLSALAVVVATVVGVLLMVGSVRRAHAQLTAWLVVPGVIVLIGVLLLVEERSRRRAAVAESEHRGRLRFRSLVQHSSDVVSIVDARGVVSYCSPSVHEVLGFDPSEQESFEIIHRLVHPDDEAHVLQAIGNMLRTPGSSVEIECRVRHADGGWRVVDNILTNLLHDPLVSGFVMNTRDVTAKREVESALHRREASFRLLFEDNPEPMWVYDRETLRFLEVNTAAVDKYGWSAAEFKRMRITDIRPEEDRERVIRNVRERGGDLRRTGPWRHLLANGREIQVEMASHALDFAGRPAALVLAFDVTEQVALQAELKHAAFHDSLTGFANRALFHDRVDHALDVSRRHAHEVAVLFADLDAFKTVNDGLGHAVGDALLVGVAERFAECLRPGDTIARLGGDEFGVLLEDVTEPSAAITVAQRLLRSLEDPFDLTGTETFVTASVGIRLSDGATMSAGTLLRDADAAMYAAKSTGNGRYRLFESAMHRTAKADLELRADLQRALQRHQLVMYYQPVVALGSGQVQGFEALIRWQHPERGLVMPAVFVPAAEETGLIAPIGRFALHEACAQARTWHDNHPGAPLSMAVNVSVRQLRGTELVDDVRDALEASGIEPRSLVLEITESTLVDDVDDVVRQLTALKQLGVRIAVDDFGTGYSSLSYLRRLPIDVLKIDRSFVEGVVGSGAEGATVVRSIVDLAHGLGLATVAEGIEDPAQLDQLRRTGCDVGQGYLLARPEDAANVSALLDRLGADLCLLDPVTTGARAATVES